MRKVIVAATQMACSGDIQENVARGEKLVREAVAKGAQIVLLQELFEGPYFCQDEFSTAIGSEIGDDEWDSAAHWQRVQQGQAGANLIPYIASNRIGTEAGKKGTEMTFYGSSFIANQFGEKVAEADRESQGVLVHEFDLDETAKHRAYWGIFRDRRPEHYQKIMTMDGK